MFILGCVDIKDPVNRYLIIITTLTSVISYVSTLLHCSSFTVYGNNSLATAAVIV